jgi:hypothetical protein
MGLALSALANAIILRKPTGTNCHSDRGCQFRATASVRNLTKNFELPSLSGLKGHTIDKCASAAKARRHQMSMKLQQKRLARNDSLRETTFPVN